MSLVDIPPPPAEDEIMDPATKQYVVSGDAIAEARSDAKLAEFRATVEAYTARAEEREAAAREREAVRVRDFARLEATLASIKRGIWTATLSAVLGIAALYAALFQGVLSMFDVGRQFGTTQAEIQRQLRVIEKRLGPDENVSVQMVPHSGKAARKHLPDGP